MESYSFVAMPLVVEVKDIAHPEFKKHPHKSKEDDPIGTFSSISHEVLHIDYVRAYIHCEIEETSLEDILDLQLDIMHEIGNPKPKFMQLQRKGFASFDEKEWVQQDT